jgi:selenocysteine lyase/cysteine desulfurase
VIPVMDNGQLDMNAYHELLNPKTAFVVVNHISNALGVTNRQRNHSRGNINIAKVIDGAQLAAMKADVQDINADFTPWSVTKCNLQESVCCMEKKRRLMSQFYQAVVVND